jgi:hypothetical protein
MPVTNRDFAVAGLKVVGDHSAGLKGTAKAGAKIELIDLSNAPLGRLHPDDVFVAGTADSSGKFTAKLDTRVKAAQAGNIVRMRAVNPDGTKTSWLDVRLQLGSKADTNNAQVAMIRLEPAVNGSKIQIINNNESRQISEPGAQLRFTNERTGKSVTVTLDKEGNLPGKKVEIEGKAGDSIKVAASDGTNNKNFATAAGIINVAGGGGGGNGGVDLPDPGLTKDDKRADGTPKYQLKRFKIPWNINSGFAKRVQQGNIGDCFFPAAIAAIADNDYKDIAKIGQRNADGSVTVTFKQRSGSGYRDVKVKVDGDLYVRASGELLYGQDVDFGIIEKAYAIMKGSYESIGKGGFASEVMEAVLGRPAYDVDIPDKSAATQDMIWDEIKKGIKEKRPMALGTHDDSKKARYNGTGVYPDHAYSVLDCRERKLANGGTVRMVQLRNPWGESEPVGNGPNDGIFEIPIDVVCHLFSSFMSVE